MIFHISRLNPWTYSSRFKHRQNSQSVTHFPRHPNEHRTCNSISFASFCLSLTPAKKQSLSLSLRQGRTLSHLVPCQSSICFLPLYISLTTLTLPCSGHPTPTRYSLNSSRCLTLPFSVFFYFSSLLISQVPTLHKNPLLLFTVQQMHCAPSGPHTLVRLVSCPRNAFPSSNSSTQSIPALVAHESSPCG